MDFWLAVLLVLAGVSPGMAQDDARVRARIERLERCGTLPAAERLACYDDVAEAIREARKRKIEDRRAIVRAPRPAPAAPPAAAAARSSGGCEIEDFNFRGALERYIHITGSTTCAKGRLILRLYDGDNRFIAAGSTYIAGHAFEAYINGRLPSRLNLRYAVEP